MSISSKQLSQTIVKGMQEKKASNIVVLDLRAIKNVISDFFVICSGDSTRQLGSIADAIDGFVFRSVQETPWHIEGKNSEEWMLLDYVTVVAHVFQNEQRTLYKLEELWGDAKIKEIKSY